MTHYLHISNCLRDVDSHVMHLGCTPLSKLSTVMIPTLSAPAVMGYNFLGGTVCMLVRIWGFIHCHYFKGIVCCFHDANGYFLVCMSKVE